MTIDKGTADHEISALSHIALLQGPLQGREKGFQNVDSSPTPPLSPTRAPRPASRESCGEGGGEHDSAMSGAQQCTHQMHQQHSLRRFGQRLSAGCSSKGSPHTQSRNHDAAQYVNLAINSQKEIN